MNKPSKIAVAIAGMGVLLLVIVVASLIYSADLPIIVRLSVVGVTLVNLAMLLHLAFRTAPEVPEDNQPNGTWDMATYTQGNIEDPTLTLQVSGVNARILGERIHKATNEGRFW